MRAVGENMPAVVRGEVTMLEPMMQDNMLNQFYVSGLGMRDYTEHLGCMASQIGHRYPHMKVLEIGSSPPRLLYPPSKPSLVFLKTRF